MGVPMGVPMSGTQRCKQVANTLRKNCNVAQCICNVAATLHGQRRLNMLQQRFNNVANAIFLIRWLIRCCMYVAILLRFNRGKTLQQHCCNVAFLCYGDSQTQRCNNVVTTSGNNVAATLQQHCVLAVSLYSPLYFFCFSYATLNVYDKRNEHNKRNEQNLQNREV